MWLKTFNFWDGYNYNRNVTSVLLEFKLDQDNLRTENNPFNVYRVEQEYKYIV